MGKINFSMLVSQTGKRRKVSGEEKQERIANLKRNWFFPISAMAFFCLAFNGSFGYCLGMLIVFPLMILIAGRMPPVWQLVRQNSAWGNLFCAASAVGICLGNREFFYLRAFREFSRLTRQASAEKLLVFLSYLGAAAAVFFVFFCLLVFWKEFRRIVSQTGMLEGIGKKEWIIYGLLLAALLAYMALIFAQTNAFYETQYTCDVVYTSDSSTLMKGNVYVTPTHPENDLRQPLFAVFAAPFAGIAYFIGGLTGASVSVQAVFVNCTQIIMLLAANFMLARMLKLDAVKRICFMLLSACTYMQLLFVLMMEQYIVAYFWLALCMYLISERKKLEGMVLWGAGGSLLTSMVLLPFMSGKSPLRNFKAWLCDTLKHGFEFIALMLVFCRFDVIYNLFASLVSLSRFTGRELTLSDKIYQYSEFVRSCFAAPNAGMTTIVHERASWQLNTATGISAVGVLILLLAIAGAIWNRDKRSSLLAAGWLGFSVVMLLGLGWGAQENGLILYSLYFGWAFLVLLFQLAERIAGKLKIGFLFPVICICGAIALLAVNVPAMMELVRFAIACYPV